MSGAASADRALPIDTASEGLVRRQLTVLSRDVVFVKGIIEASDGLAQVFAESGGELSIVSPRGREAEVDELLMDLREELSARLSPACAGKDGGSVG